jgi:alpha-amylase
MSAANGNGYVVNLFMDYETFGEHQWEDTGIFKFLEKLPEEILKHPDNNFVTVSEAAEKYSAVAEMDIHNFMSWADIERDLSAWLGNQLQNAAANELYKIGKLVKQAGDKKLIDDWRKLTTSDHFYYMCIKWFSDGDVHKYFNPYDTPYEGFITFMNVLNDVVIRVREINKQREPKESAGATATAVAYSRQDGASFRHNFISEHPSATLSDISLVSGPGSFNKKDDSGIKK